MPKFEVQFMFMKPCYTTGWTIEAKDADEALAKCRECIVDGDLDIETFLEEGGETGSWDVCDGGDAVDYEIDHDSIVELNRR